MRLRADSVQERDDWVARLAPGFFALEASAPTLADIEEPAHGRDSHVVKIQVPMDDLGTHPQRSPNHLAGYNRLRNTTFVILKDDNDYASFDELVQAIRLRGIAAAKGYFSTWGVGDVNLEGPASGEIALDLHCLMPPRPF